MKIQKKQIIVDNFLDYEKEFANNLNDCIKDMISKTRKYALSTRKA